MYIIFFALLIYSTFTIHIGSSRSVRQYFPQGIINTIQNINSGNKSTPNKHYDFIVIGAGPGGCVVANRLSENPLWTVLIIEAGQYETEFTDIPAATIFLEHTEYNWNYTAERSENACFSFENNRCPWIKGRGVGGSSIINSMFYTRGKMEDYDTIAALGNPGWAYKDVLPYFLKSENNSIPEYQNSPYHSHYGNLHVERVRYHSPLADKFIEGGGELGLHKNIDYTVNPEDGVSRLQATTLNGRRVSSYTAYILPAKNRKNLHVSIFSRATKIIIDPQTKKATGVEFIKDGKSRVVHAKKEVILSAGPINSPQLLMLSGVGSKEHLENLGIRVIHDLPAVGQNLQDHYGTAPFEFGINITNPTINEQTIKDPKLFDEWKKFGRGPLTVPMSDGIGYTRTPSDKEIELILNPLGFEPNTFLMGVMLLQPDARGCVTLKSNNPLDPPNMSYSYYEHGTDLTDNIYGLKYAVKLIEDTQAFKDVAAKLNPYSKCEHYPFKSDDYFVCLSKYLTYSYQHQCGTCKMGDVVNYNLEVFGIENLRVVDSSIFPHIPRGHIYAPTIMVGEKGSDLIRNRWLK